MRGQQDLRRKLTSPNRSTSGWTSTRLLIFPKIPSEMGNSGVMVISMQTCSMTGGNASCLFARLLSSFQLAPTGYTEHRGRTQKRADRELEPAADKSRGRRRKLDGFENWHVHLVIESLPVMHPLALLLLASAPSLCPRKISHAVAWIILVFAFLGMASCPLYSRGDTSLHPPLPDTAFHRYPNPLPDTWRHERGRLLLRRGTRIRAGWSVVMPVQSIDLTCDNP